MALDADPRDRDGLELTLIAFSRRERWAWDALNAMTQAALRNPFQPTSPELANWAADVLAGKEPRPRGKGKRLLNRDLAIAETIVLICERYGLKPTRSLRGLPECCVEGGSACDVLGVASGMNYKAVESIWNEWGVDATERLQAKGFGYVLFGQTRPHQEYWPESEIK